MHYVRALYRGNKRQIKQKCLSVAQII